MLATTVPGLVWIRFVYVDGQLPPVESDAYAEITSIGGAPVNLSGWRVNAGDEGRDF